MTNNFTNLALLLIAESMVGIWIFLILIWLRLRDVMACNCANNHFLMHLLESADIQEKKLNKILSRIGQVKTRLADEERDDQRRKAQERRDLRRA